MRRVKIIKMIKIDILILALMILLLNQIKVLNGLQVELFQEVLQQMILLVLEK